MSMFTRLFATRAGMILRPLRRDMTGMVKRFTSQMRSFGTLEVISTWDSV